MAVKILYLLLVCLCAADDLREDAAALFQKVLSDIQNATTHVALQVDESIKRIVGESRINVRTVGRSWDRSLQRLLDTSKEYNVSVEECLNELEEFRSVEMSLSADADSCLDDTMEKSMRRVSDEMAKIMSVAVLVLHEYAQEAEQCEIEGITEARLCMLHKMELVTQQQMRVAEQYMESANAAFMVVKEFTLFALECTAQAVAQRSTQARRIEETLADCIREKTNQNSSE